MRASHEHLNTPAVFCLATSRGRADCLLLELKQAGFPADEIAVLFLDRTPAPTPERERRERAAYGAAAQSAGPIRGVLAGIKDVGRLVVPDGSAFIAAGAIMHALHETGGATPGIAIAPALTLLGLPPADAARYERGIKADGHFLVMVQAGDPAQLARARSIFAETNGQDICACAGAASAPSPLAH